MRPARSWGPLACGGPYFFSNKVGTLLYCTLVVFLKCYIHRQHFFFLGGGGGSSLRWIPLKVLTVLFNCSTLLL